MSQIEQTQSQIIEGLKVKGFDLGSILLPLIPILLDKLLSGCNKEETEETKVNRIATFVTTSAGKAQLIREVRRQDSTLTNKQAVAIAEAIGDQLQQKSVVSSLLNEAKAIDNWDLV